MRDPKKLYGQGLRFPIVPGPDLKWVWGGDAVAQAVRSVLLTEPGERVGRVSYGAGLRQFLFAPNTLTVRSRIRQRVTEAIERDEPRVNLDDVEVSTDSARPTLLHIEVRYKLVGETTPRNLVFPFYLEEEAV